MPKKVNVKVKGPKDGKYISADFYGLSKQNFSDLKLTTTLCLLSIKNNQYCENEYLGAIINQALAKHKFSTFLIADEIYWHNLKEPNCDKNEEVLRKEATKLGLEFFEKNLTYFLEPLNLTIDVFNKKYPYDSQKKIEIINNISKKENLRFEILTWNTWSKKEESLYKQNECYINSLYQIDPLKSAIMQDAVEYLDRHKNSDQLPESFIRMNSEAYLREENPRIILSAMINKYNFIVYPGGILRSLEESKKIFEQVTIQTALNIQIAEPHKYANWLCVHFTRLHSPINHRSNLSPKILSTLFKNQVVPPSQITPTDFISAAVAGFTKEIILHPDLINKINDNNNSDDPEKKFFEKVINASVSYSFSLFQKIQENQYREYGPSQSHLKYHNGI